MEKFLFALKDSIYQFDGVLVGWIALAILIFMLKVGVI